jgi:hypothetical protein
MAAFVYLTGNTEYHVASGVCTRVICRAEGRELAGHDAIGAHLLGGFRFDSGDRVRTDEPSRGDSLYFLGEELTLVTTPVEHVLPYLDGDDADGRAADDAR